MSCFEIIVNIFVCFGAVGTVGAFVMLFVKDRQKQEQINRLTDIADSQNKQVKELQNIAQSHEQQIAELTGIANNIYNLQSDYYKSLRLSTAPKFDCIIWKKNDNSFMLKISNNGENGFQITEFEVHDVGYSYHTNLPFYIHTKQKNDILIIKNLVNEDGISYRNIDKTITPPNNFRIQITNNIGIVYGYNVHILKSGTKIEEII